MGVQNGPGAPAPSGPYAEAPDVPSKFNVQLHVVA